MKDIYLNFTDLSEETQEYIKDLAIEEIKNDAGTMEEIKNSFDAEMIEEIINERAESLISQFNYIFNV